MALPTGIAPGDAGHIGHHDALHAMFNEGNAKGDLLVAIANDTWDNLAVGADGRFLIADSTTATGLRWSDEPIVRTLLNAKGDIIAATAADTAGVLTVGANGKVLEADSTQATGLKWGDDPIRKSLIDAIGDLIAGSAADTAVRLAVGSSGALLLADSGQTAGLRYALAQGATVATSESTTSASYVDLTTPGPAVTITVGASGLALVQIGAFCLTQTVGNEAKAAYAVSGATTVAAADARNISMVADSTNNGGVTIGRSFLISGLTPGSNTLTMKYAASNGTNSGIFVNRHIWAIGL